LLDACEQKHVELKLCALNPQPLDILGRTGLLARLKPGGVVADWQTAIDSNQADKPPKND
jgi:hypothetical protein